MELDRRGAELLLRVPIEREEKNSVAIASNEAYHHRLSICSSGLAPASRTRV
ncbi:hypothetical protein GCM10009738_86800 [Kitasatospora viridis]|uniref:Uncharacterized protein n=1 Tax=Kitasatospora viridis TaxID=281105 RepID=A0A561S9N3_9ACTN|nr:hypothetical protein FHX73_19211 [Kitasatospora viridis]